MSFKTSNHWNKRGLSVRPFKNDILYEAYLFFISRWRLILGTLLQYLMLTMMGRLSNTFSSTEHSQKQCLEFINKHRFSDASYLKCFSWLLTFLLVLHRFIFVQLQWHSCLLDWASLSSWICIKCSTVEQECLRSQKTSR